MSEKSLNNTENDETLIEELNHDINKFNGEITEFHLKEYNNEKLYKIKTAKNPDLLFNINLWDICFASSYDFPNYPMGFCGQWMQNKIAPLAEHMSEIDLVENVHICYRPINENDEHSLDYLCNNVIRHPNRGKEFAGRKMSGNFNDYINNYNYWVTNYPNEERLSFERSYYYEYKVIEIDPFQYIFGRKEYNCLYLNSRDARNNFYIRGNFNEQTDNIIRDGLIFSKYEDIEENMKYINDINSYLYEDNRNEFNSNYEKWLNLIKKVKTYYNIIGHDKPFWTGFLPENISNFEEVRVLINQPNDLDIIARSKKNFYYFSYSY